MSCYRFSSESRVIFQRRWSRPFLSFTRSLFLSLTGAGRGRHVLLRPGFLAVSRRVTNSDEDIGIIRAHNTGRREQTSSLYSILPHSPMLLSFQSLLLRRPVTCGLAVTAARLNRCRSAVIVDRRRRRRRRGKITCFWIRQRRESKSAKSPHRRCH